jgi:hypothetical protein
MPPHRALALSSAATLPATMNWLLPITLVLAVALLVAAIHFVFMRWMARQPAPVPVYESDGQESIDAERQSVS